MKLKKIASLALAGIMAVSMLAGCGEGTNQEDPSSSGQVPTTTNVVTYANDALSASEKEVISFTSSSALDTLLQKVATNPANFDSDAIEKVFNSFTLYSTAGATTAEFAEDLSKDVADGLTGQRGIAFSAFNTFPVDKASQKVVVVGIISGNVEEKAAVQEFVDAYANSIAIFPKTVYDTSTTPNTLYACKYTGEISAIKVASPESSDKTAWVMAAVATQTVTKTV